MNNTITCRQKAAGFISNIQANSQSIQNVPLERHSPGGIAVGLLTGRNITKMEKCKKIIFIKTLQCGR